MNLTLFNAMLKANSRMISGFLGGSVCYLALVVWIYPSIADSKGLNDMIQSMPQSVQQAFGMQGGINSLVDYLASEFYGLLFLIILMIYAVSTATQLIARLVDRGAMAYMLSTPVSRFKVAFTQTMVMLCGMVAIILVTTLAGLVLSDWIVPDAKLKTDVFIQLNVMLFLLFAVISGYSFLFSCLFNDEKRALGVSAGLTILFFAMNLAGKLSPDINWLKKLSLFTAFDPQAIVKGDENLFLTGSLLGIGAIILFVAAMAIFSRKDLPL
ncbi:ABC-2 type transport system permease protein [Scopulibacillus darangshiensis]|uniref:ABC-2 type transport system permease protein n=1 Tax=Scopulibacillus darangshiensis TaxID=442528 RepID=A0A4R2P6K0_9BACL|nr:ABC transporter permease subunit [Scopulibacillus darangshiensis]TCP29784.1 ABC-2 type transport system permease protein [Scopulibacillus darangshiensis]